jgi:hypothetical protein
LPRVVASPKQGPEHCKYYENKFFIQTLIIYYKVNVTLLMVSSKIYVIFNLYLLIKEGRFLSKIFVRFGITPGFQMKLQDMPPPSQTYVRYVQPYLGFGSSGVFRSSRRRPIVLPNTQRPLSRSTDEENSSASRRHGRTPAMSGGISRSVREGAQRRVAEGRELQQAARAWKAHRPMRPMSPSLASARMLSRLGFAKVAAAAIL